LVKHFTNDEADAGSNPADILYVALNYFIINRRYYNEIIFLKFPWRGSSFTILVVNPYVIVFLGKVSWNPILSRLFICKLSKIPRRGVKIILSLIVYSYVTLFLFNYNNV
jgi:hypothetical protein